MRCPSCHKDGFHSYQACTQCGFAGTPSQIEELSHIAYLLGELETWRVVPSAARDQLRTSYTERRQVLEIDLGLRAPPLTAKEARQLQWELFCLGQLQEKVVYWLGQGWVRADPAARLRQGAGKRAEALGQRLRDAPPAPEFNSTRDRLKLLVYLEKIATRAHQRGHFVDDEAYAAALANIQTEREKLEIKAGLRPRPVAPAAAPATASAAATPGAALVEKAPTRPPRPPREPITWDRMWQTLLSERTLNVLLFLGAFLLVASATTYVIYNWESLPAAVQLAFIILFTLSFYGAGWFLRVRMGLRLSGIAVTAVGSLLVPLDFYAIFIAGEVLPADAWPWVWLVASAVCLPIYTFTALRIRAEFFGYLVAVAAGSLLCATLRVLGIPDEWWLTALTALALILITLAYRLLEPVAEHASWSILSNPLRLSALIAPAVILPLSIGWWLVGDVGGFHFDASLAGAWTLGALLYAYAAVREQSPLLGRAAATALPVALFLLQRLAFEPWEVEMPWYALGWAILAPVYVWVGHRFLRGPQPGTTSAVETDPVLRAHGHTATGWGLALVVLAAGWSLFDLWAAAATHAALIAGVVLAIRLWERPRALPVASLLAFSAITFGMAAGHLAPAELCLGWALLAVLHILAALRLRIAPEYAARLFGVVPIFVALALLPPLLFRDEPLLTYVLGHWIAVAAWLLWLDHTGEHAGLTALLNHLGPLRRSVLHWAIALALPFFATMLYTRFRSIDGWLALLLALLAWGCFAIGQLRRISEGGQSTWRWALAIHYWSFPWYVVAYVCSVAAPLLAFYAFDEPLLGVTVLLASALYFASAWAFRADQWLIPAGLALPLGLFVLLTHWQVPWSQQSVALASVVAAYLLGGLWLEQRRDVPRDFMASLYAVAHLVAFIAVIFGLDPAVERLLYDRPWPDPARLWAAAGQLVLGVAYGLVAWFHAQERWAHTAAWLGVMAGGLVATAYSQGRGSSAFKAALLVAVYVLAERALHSEMLKRYWPLAGRAWTLYRRALLIAGWTVSAGAIGLALFRNLVLLGGAQLQTIWAIVGLLTVTALYALSAWLFRRRLFLWLAGALIVAPWTLLTLWGWFLWPAPPSLPRYALSWALLACLQLGIGLTLTLYAASPQSPDYGFPLRTIAHALLPFALFWAVADPATSAITWGLGAAFYVVSTIADHRRGLTGWRAARFLYPAVAATPVWAIYLLNYFLPTAFYEWYGLLLLAFALPLLAIGLLLRRIDPADGLPLYLGAYGVAIVGTMLVAHQRPLLAYALTFDALLCVLSAWVFREPLWGYPAAALAPAAMLIALAESEVPTDQRGWWLIGLGAVYVVLAWVLRRLDQREYATPALAMAFIVVALGLPPSSLSDTAAFWGYLAAALVYVLVAAWLRQPLLLTASAALLAVPYGVALVWLEVNPIHYGLALLPGAGAALALAHLLDWQLGRPSPILPALDPKSWRLAKLLDWWAAPFYAWGYIAALVAIGLSLQFRSGQDWADSMRLAVVLALAALIFVHATWRFRSRGYLLLAGVLAQGAVLAVINAVGWLEHPSWAALAFLPVTMLTATLALAVERWRCEGSPLSAAWFDGWSRPLYLLLAADLLLVQLAALTQAEPGTIVTVAHALLLALLATVWMQPLLPFVATALGTISLLQGMVWANAELTTYPPGLALLALGYGLGGYGLAYILPEEQRARPWRKPLEWTAWGLSTVALVLTAGASLRVLDLLVYTFLGRTVTFAHYAAQVRTVMWALALTGLLYLATALVRRWYVLGYGAVAFLLGAWALWWRFFQYMAGFQWYAVPAGLYLLAVGWMEWRQGRKALARWIDRAGMLVWLGTAWWQSLPGVMSNGWPYALLMGIQSLLLVWWGSARRQKRFLYVGAAGVVLNAVTQSIEPLLSANRWIVFGLAGLLLVGIAVLVERRLEAIRELSAELRERLEGWE